MPYSGRINVTIGETQLKEVEYFGEAIYSPVRRGKTGWGMAIEVPAVIEMIRLVDEGKTSADRLVRLLESVAENIRTDYGEDEEGETPWGADCPSEGCTVCDGAKEEFAALAARTHVERQRFQDPDNYPYVRGKHTLHRAACSEAQRGIGSRSPDWTRNEAQDLRSFAHEHVTNSGWATHMTMLTPEDVAQWIATRTGPRGGAQYKLCKICRPSIPQART
ncbi:hypothetical protein [Streptomyces sp. rh34]|uniref:hypothetical protein n=1 Tax=Streptomyces sp. rh34 TaxID=2034272 RepID=UPI000BF00053|nr:hypothetical protein [Streptomyces sp. rh34]